MIKHGLLGAGIAVILQIIFIKMANEIVDIVPLIQTGVICFVFCFMIDYIIKKE